MSKINRNSIKRLIRKYDRKRAASYRKFAKAVKSKDKDRQFVFTVYQMAYTEIQCDLERLS